MPPRLAELLSTHLRTEQHPTAVRRSLTLLIHLATPPAQPPASLQPVSWTNTETSLPHQAAAGHDSASPAAPSAAGLHPASISTSDQAAQHTSSSPATMPQQPQQRDGRVAASSQPADLKQLTATKQAGSAQQCDTAHQMHTSPQSLSWRQDAQLLASSSHVDVCCAALRLLGHAVRTEACGAGLARDAG